MTAASAAAGEPWPTELRVTADRAALTVGFDDGETFRLPAPLLRAMTPSAQDRGHGGPSFAPVPGVGDGVRLEQVEPVGRYAVRLGFSDGHSSGLYTWARLHRIGRERDRLAAEVASGGRASAGRP